MVLRDRSGGGHEKNTVCHRIRGRPFEQRGNERGRSSRSSAMQGGTNEARCWEGLYLGANAGYAWGSGSNLNPGASGVQTGVFLDGPAQLAAQVAGLAPLGLSTKGSLGGGQIGYNWQAGTIVWGIETDFDGAHVSS